jgi:hypothetical protein
MGTTKGPQAEAASQARKAQEQRLTMGDHTPTAPLHRQERVVIRPRQPGVWNTKSSSTAQNKSTTSTVTAKVPPALLGGWSDPLQGTGGLPKPGATLVRAKKALST